MDRLACVELSDLPLQLLLRRHPEWAGLPVVVVAEDRPLALVQAANEEARRAGVLPGLRQVQALSLAAGLRASTVSAGEVRAATAELTGRLRRFSPEVEPATDEPGLFWLAARGLERLFPSLLAWAELIAAEVAAVGLRASVVVGFSRFGTCALARASGRDTVRVLASPEEEGELVRRVPLARLGIDPELREALARLGVREVAGLLRLPAAGLLERFGPAAHELQQQAAGALWAPLQPEPELPPPRERFELDDGELDLTRLVFLIKRLLDRLLAALARRGQAVSALVLRLRFERQQGSREMRLRPAAPSLDGAQLLELARLRLESQGLEAAVIAVEIEAATVPAATGQLELFAGSARRNLDAANRALARLRAELGEEAVVHAVLHDRYLPEARFEWVPLEQLSPPREPPRDALRDAPREAPRAPPSPRGQIARRAAPSPRRAQISLGPATLPKERAPSQPPLPGRVVPEPAGSLSGSLSGSVTASGAAAGVAPGAASIAGGRRPLVRRILAAPHRRVHPPGPGLRLRGGPYIISGAWWRGHEVHREYHFAEASTGELLWIYYDPRRRCWLLQGRVE